MNGDGSDMSQTTLVEQAGTADVDEFIDRQPVGLSGAATPEMAQ